MFGFLSGNDFWLSSSPLFILGALAALIALAWDWRIILPALLLAQIGIGHVTVQRADTPNVWSGIFVAIVVACLLILLLSIQYGKGGPTAGRWGMLIFRGLLLGMAALLLSTLETTNLLPRLDGDMTHLILWMAVCALFGLAHADGAFSSASALLLWLIGTEAALLPIAPAAIVVVLLGTLFLLITLACSYLLIAENVALAEDERPLTDAIFPTQSAFRFDLFTDRVMALVQQLARRTGGAPGGKRS